MIAIIFHYWLGMILILAGGLAVFTLVLSYLKVVTAAKYPNGKRRRED